MYPGKNGGTYIIYNRFLKVFVLKHQNTIDNGLNKAKDKFDKSNNTLNLIKIINLVGGLII
jgi:hypothetical protein